MPHPLTLRLGRFVPSERLFFGGVYGSVLACALAAALDQEYGPPDPGYDALWVLLTALASSCAHGYALSIAHHAPSNRGITRTAVQSVLAEWPLTAAAMPTVVMLLASYAGWWAEATAVSAALAFNTVALFGWGLWAARAVARRSWPSACLAGCVDMGLGLLIVAVNVLSK